MTQTAIKERGIIFTPWSIPKIMDRTKTQTRRTYGLEFVNQDPDVFEFLRMEGDLAVFHKLRNSYRNAGEIPFPPRASFPKKMEGVDPNVLFYIKCPYGQVGERLWVREQTTYLEHILGLDILIGKDMVKVLYHATGDEKYIHIPEEYRETMYHRKLNRPSLYIHRWVSRQDLEITSLRAERLQDISGLDCIREGLLGDEYRTAPQLIGEYAELWDSLNPKYSFDFNPWVWPIGFKLT